MSASPQPDTLPLFPLQTVLFPGGLLALKVFEARYLDMVSACLRESRPFGVVALRSGSDVGADAGAEFETIGTLAELIEVDSESPGILRVHCRGTRRFSLLTPILQADGLWTTPVETMETIEDDEPCAPAGSTAATVSGLRSAIDALEVRGPAPFLQPYRFDDAGWVANRWCEILPLSLAAKHKLMALPDAQMRLQLVDEFLRGKGVVP